MTKLEGFSKVAVVKYGCFAYYFAIYDDGNDYKVGDMAVFSGNTNPAKITEIISEKEWKKRMFPKNITAEVIGKIDISAYEKRLEQRELKKIIKETMENRKKKIQEELDDEYYASKDEDYAELLRKYESL
jgi:predicted nucleic acid-binding protein